MAIMPMENSVFVLRFTFLADAVTDPTPMSQSIVIVKMK
jgi:hypothetical protein